MKYLFSLIFTVLILLCGISCQKERSENQVDLTQPQECTFFGDSTLTIISSNKSNGYGVKIFMSKDIILLNLSRGDTINQYIPLGEIPLSLVIDSDIKDLIVNGSFPEDSIGTFVREINIPIEKESLGVGIFFMDVNFDGEEELVVEHPGYNRKYYACFDIVNGIANVTPGILHPMNDEPYNNLVSAISEHNPCSTDFDYQNKTIRIFEQMGCCAHVETWCELVREYEWEKPSVKVVRREIVDHTGDDKGNLIEEIKVYVRENDELVLKEDKKNRL